jgi:hypothetical protein
MVGKPIYTPQEVSVHNFNECFIVEIYGYPIHVEYASIMEVIMDFVYFIQFMLDAYPGGLAAYLVLRAVYALVAIGFAARDIRHGIFGHEVYSTQAFVLIAIPYVGELTALIWLYGAARSKITDRLQQMAWQREREIHAERNERIQRELKEQQAEETRRRLSRFNDGDAS